MTQVPVLTIDGPSGVGKGTVARLLARELGWHLLDSGAIYRIAAVAAQDAGLDLEDGEAVAALVASLPIRFAQNEDGSERIELDGRDITARVRTEQAGALASVIAAQPVVRAALLERQRAFRRPPGLVADGRDMGTVVFPDAVAKVFLDAAPEVRAQRRLQQLQQMGMDAKFERLCEEIRERDHRDRTRPVAPLVPAPDALVIDTGALGPEEVAARVREHLLGRLQQT